MNIFSGNWFLLALLLQNCSIRCRRNRCWYLPGRRGGCRKHLTSSAHGTKHLFGLPDMAVYGDNFTLWWVKKITNIVLRFVFWPFCADNLSLNTVPEVNKLIIYLSLMDKTCIYRNLKYIIQPCCIWVDAGRIYVRFKKAVTKNLSIFPALASMTVTGY